MPPAKGGAAISNGGAGLCGHPPTEVVPCKSRLGLEKELALLYLLSTKLGSR